MITLPFFKVAEDLELAGLIWRPEIGDEIAERRSYERVSVLVDPHGMTPTELRALYLWLPTVEQMISQFEARQAILDHLGLELNERAMGYKTVVRAPTGGIIECLAESIRNSVGLALRGLLLKAVPRNMN
jgi:hypothetical protein